MNSNKLLKYKLKVWCMVLAPIQEYVNLPESSEEFVWPPKVTDTFTERMNGQLHLSKVSCQTHLTTITNRPQETRVSHKQFQPIAEIWLHTTAEFEYHQHTTKKFLHFTIYYVIFKNIITRNITNSSFYYEMKTY